MCLRLRTLAFFVMSAAVLIGSSACGSGSSSGSSNSGSKVVGTAPQISSTPVTVALQDSPYVYSVAAVDPSGGSVSFALTTAPTGATLSGGSVSWTPTAAQSRQANNFKVTATTSNGGSTSQSWTVTPNGTVQVTDAITNWGSGGATALPTISWSASYPAASLVVPQADGLMTAIYGSGDNNGVLSFKNVPAGYFWLNISNGYYWTSSSNIDFGTDVSEANTTAPLLAGGSATPTSFNLNLTGLDSTTDPSLIGFVTVPNSVGVETTVQDATSVSWSSAPSSSSTTSSLTSSVNIQADVTQVHDGFVLQEEPASLGPLAGYVLGPAATLSGLSLQNGVANTINATLSPSAQVALPLRIEASAWNSMFNDVAPTAPTLTSSPFSLLVQPYAVGVNLPSGSAAVSSLKEGWTTTGSITQMTAAFTGPMPISLFWPAPIASTTASGFPNLALPGPVSCSSGLSETITYTGQICGGTSTGCPNSQGPSVAPLLTSDTDFGTIQYSDPFPPSWQRVFNFCQQATLPLPNLTTTSNIQSGETETFTWSYNLFNSQSTALPTSPVVPLVSPVVNPTVNGVSLFTPATLNTRAVTLSWSKPALGTPYGYRVQAVSLQQSTIVPVGLIEMSAVTRTLYTAQTSLTIPPELLTSGQTYFFDITALMDAKANVESSPRRSGLPTAAANVVSAPIVINASVP